MWIFRALACALCLSISGKVLSTVDSVPQRSDSNLIVAAYNIQWLGQKRHDYQKLASVIKHFDICGIVEIKDEVALAQITQILEDETGHDWGYVYGVRTHRPGGSYHEAYGAIWRRDRVQLGDGIISGVWDRDEKFRNDPFIVSFDAGELDFAMMLVHTRWTDDDDGSRKGEVAELGRQIEFMRGFLDEDDIFLAGDFNYPLTNSNMVRMSERADLEPIDRNENTTFKRDLSGYASAYDHVYATETARQLLIGQAEVLDVTQLIYGNTAKSSMRASKSELSDHLPVFFVLRR